MRNLGHGMEPSGLAVKFVDRLLSSGLGRGLAGTVEVVEVPVVVDTATLNVVVTLGSSSWRFCNLRSSTSSSDNIVHTPLSS